MSLKVSHVEIYQNDLDNGTEFKEVSCTDKGVIVETLKITFDEKGRIQFGYNTEWVV